MAEPVLKRRTNEELMENARMTERRPITLSTAQAEDDETLGLQFDENNVFWRILSDTKMSPAKKEAELVKAMTFDEKRTKQENNELQEQQAMATAYLSRKQVAQDKAMIELQDPTSQAKLHALFVKIESRIREYDEWRAPQDNATTAYYNLRTAKGGPLHYAAFNEIKNKEAAEEAKKQAVAAADAALTQLREDIQKLIRENAENTAEIKKLESFFGAFFKKKTLLVFGDLNEKTQNKLDTAKAALDKGKAELPQKQQQEAQDDAALKDLIAKPAYESVLKGYEAEVSVLTDALKKTPQEHTDETIKMLQSLTGFLDDAAKEGDSLGARLTTQLQNIVDHEKEHDVLNGYIRQIESAGRLAAAANQALLETYSKAPEGEKEGDAEAREAKLAAIRSYNDASDATAADMLRARSMMQEHAIALDNMKKNVSNIRRMVINDATTGLAAVSSSMTISVTNFQLQSATESMYTMSIGADVMKSKTQEQTALMEMQQANAPMEEAARMAAQIQQTVDDCNRREAIAQMERQGRESLKKNMAVWKEVLKQAEELTEKFAALSADMDMQDTRGEVDVRGVLTSQFQNAGTILANGKKAAQTARASRKGNEANLPGL